MQRPRGACGWTAAVPVWSASCTRSVLSSARPSPSARQVRRTVQLETQSLHSFAPAPCGSRPSAMASGWRAKAHSRNRVRKSAMAQRASRSCSQPRQPLCCRGTARRRQGARAAHQQFPRLQVKQSRPLVALWVCRMCRRHPPNAGQVGSCGCRNGPRGGLCRQRLPWHLVTPLSLPAIRVRLPVVLYHQAERELQLCWCPKWLKCHQRSRPPPKGCRATRCHLGDGHHHPHHRPGEKRHLLLCHQ
mmetsp:Transcript_10523/g.32731  ORF Transcript_10523/g.32731 Transcript_10523/m.32731 type:complete len:246 (+) Transcript_10523:369-1106(+)